VSNNGAGGHPKFKRVLLKLSGEAFAGSGADSIDSDTLDLIATQIQEVVAAGVQVAIVVGGGNIWRGRAARSTMDRASADYMGMLATVINSLALQDALESAGVATRVLSAISMHQVAEPYIRRRAIRHLEKGRVVIFAAGTGNPYFTTDTAAGLRAVEIGADAILKATQVDGVYSADPKKDPTAVRFESLEYIEVLKRGLEVMDNTALALCMDNGFPIIVLELMRRGNIKKAIWGEPIGTIVRKAESSATPTV